MIFNIGDKVDYVKEDVQGKVVRKGTNYVVVEDNKNNLHKMDMGLCRLYHRQR